MSDIVSRNLLVYPYYRLNSTDNGVSMVVNNDGSITLNGTASSNVESQNKFYDLNSDSKLELPVGEYIFSIDGLPVIDMYSQFLVREVVAPYTAIISINNTAPFTITQEIADKLKTGDYNVQIKLCVRTNRTIDNVTVYPMIRLSSDPDNTWEPYHPPIHVPDVYFRCTSTAGGAKLEVSYGDEFVGKVLTATNGNKTIRRMAGTSGTVTFTVPESGLWTVSGEVDGTTYSVQESVVLDYSVALVSGFDYKSWLTAGGVDPTSYSSLADVLADEILVRRLMTIHAAVDYLASFQTVNADLETVINNDICAKWINDRDYALDTLHANSAIAAVMDEANKYFYGEYCLMPQVPKMTSNTAPSGEASADNVYGSGYEAYRAFDGDESTRWAGAATPVENTKLFYKFTNSICAKKIRVHAVGAMTITPIASNDGSNWVNLSEGRAFSANEDYTFEVSNTNYYLYYGVKCSNLGGGGATIYTLQFYAYAPKGCVPVMTANTAPYGEAFGSSMADNGTPYYAPFAGYLDEGSYHVWSSQSNKVAGEYVGYKFTNPTCVKSFELNNRVISYTGTSIKDFKLQASNDGTTYVDLGTYEKNTTDASQRFTVDNDNYYLYYRIYVLTNRGGSNVSTPRLQFYGRQLSVSVPVMTSNTAPFGEVVYTSQSSNTDLSPWKCFDGSDSTRGASSTNPAPSSSNPWGIGYNFGIPVVVKLAEFIPRNNKKTKTKIQGSNDGTTWVNLTDWIDDSDSSGSNHRYIVNVQNENAYKYYRAGGYVSESGDWGMEYATVKFYGLDYSEKEFEAGTTKKWLYDHGVELETINYSMTTTTSTAANDGERIQFNTAANTSNAIGLANMIDLTNYDLIRAKVGDNFYSSVSGTFFYLAEENQTTLINPEASSSYDVGNGNLPNNLSLDISNVNSTRMPFIYCQNGNASQKADLVEWWLE